MSCMHCTSPVGYGEYPTKAIAIELGLAYIFRGNRMGFRMANLVWETVVIWVLFGLYVWIFTLPMGPVGAAFWYPQEVQDRFVELGLTTHERIARRQRRSSLGWLVIIALLFAFVVIVNKQRGFWPMAWQIYLLVELMELFDLLFVDTWWVAISGWWDIPGTEDLQHLYKNWLPKLIKKGSVILVAGIPLSALLAGLFVVTTKLLGL